jgi:hypothetical protein
MKIEICNKPFVVDECDMPIVLSHRWHLVHGRPMTVVNGRHVLMYRLFVSANQGYVVDHIDGDISNNSRNNLRVCTQAQNTLNNRGHSDRKYIYKGVKKTDSGWVSSIKNLNFFHSRINLGTYRTEREAAVAYDVAAIAINGEFAKLNVADATYAEMRVAADSIKKSLSWRSRKLSRYRGVTFDSGCGRWRFQLYDGKTGVYHRKRFDNEEDAARFHDVVATVIYGDAAILNFPKKAA